MSSYENVQELLVLFDPLTIADEKGQSANVDSAEGENKQKAEERNTSESETQPKQLEETAEEINVRDVVKEKGGAGELLPQNEMERKEGIHGKNRSQIEYELNYRNKQQQCTITITHSEPGQPLVVTFGDGCVQIVIVCCDGEVRLTDELLKNERFSDLNYANIRRIVLDNITVYTVQGIFEWVLQKSKMFPKLDMVEVYRATRTLGLTCALHAARCHLGRWMNTETFFRMLDLNDSDGDAFLQQIINRHFHDQRTEILASDKWIPFVKNKSATVIAWMKQSIISEIEKKSEA